MAPRAVARASARTAAASLVVLLAACGGAGDTVTTEQAGAPVAGRGSTPTVHDPIVIPPAPTFAEAPATSPPPASSTTSAQGDALLPTGADAASWSTAELVAWAGQLDGYTLPVGGT